MREAFFILVVIAVLLCWTAIKYRRQIVTMIEFYKHVKAAQSKLRDTGSPRPNLDSVQGIQLIKCSRCGKWIPQSEAMGDVSRPVCKRGCETHKRA
jgi:hypothetical protein